MKMKFKTQPTQRKERMCKGVMTLINSRRNGQRLVFDENFINQIEFKEGDTLQLEYDPDTFCLDVAVHPTFGKEEGFIPLKRGKKYVIYSSGLVREIVEIFRLDYSDGVSKTFSDFKRMRKKNGKKFARIIMPRPELIGEEKNDGH